MKRIIISATLLSISAIAFADYENVSRCPANQVQECNLIKDNRAYGSVTKGDYPSLSEKTKCSNFFVLVNPAQGVVCGGTISDYPPCKTTSQTCDIAGVQE